MKRKMALIVLASAVTLSCVLSGCAKNKSSNGNDIASDSSDADMSQKSITIVNSKSEVSEQISELASAYQSETGVTVNVINIPSGVNAQATVKGLYLSDQMPDIIACEAASFSNWDGLLVDMSSEQWAGRTDAEYVDTTYGTIGFPYATEAIGLACNEDILEKAEIDISSLTSPDAYSEAFKKIDSMKHDLGLIAVVGYATEPENLGWSAGNHIFGNYLDAGLNRSDTTYIDKLNNGGQFDDDRLTAFADFIGLLQKYSDPELLTEGTYDEQIKRFACGKYAFVTQGSWIGATLTGNNSEDYEVAGKFKVGMTPFAFQDGIDTILTSPPSWWAVPKEGNAEEAKAFLQWCSESSGQKILVEKAGFVSPFSDCSYVADDPFASIIASYINSGKTSSWHWMNMKEGLGTNSLCYIFNAYAKNEYDTEGFADALKEAAAEYYAN